MCRSVGAGSEEEQCGGAGCKSSGHRGSHAGDRARVDLEGLPDPGGDTSRGSGVPLGAGGGMSRRREALDVQLPGVRGRATDFLALTRPRVVLMVLVTTFVGFYLGTSGG